MPHEFFISITGAKQGKFKGEGAAKPHQEKILASAFEFEAFADVKEDASGQPLLARVRYEPIVFKKEFGAASPQLMSALAKNEMLITVLFEFLRTPDGGGEVVYYTLKLTNALVVAMKRFTSDGPGPEPAAPAGQPAAPVELEEWKLVFEEYEEEHQLAKTVAQNSWVGHGEVG